MQQESQEYRPTLRLCEIDRPSAGSCGFHLSRTFWDPYPWVSGIEPGTPAEVAGLQTGDCVLEVNGEDVLGERIGQVAKRVRAKDEKVTLLLWNAGAHPQSFTNAVSGNGPTPLSLQRLSSCLQSILQLLECPVCLETVPPPAFQCCNGHMLCGGCRSRADRCPVCRVALGPRGRCLLADKLHSVLNNTLSHCQESKSTSAKQVAPTSVQPKLYLKSRIVTEENSCNSLPEDTSQQSKSPSVDDTSSERASQLKASSAEDISCAPQSSAIRSRSLSAGQIFLKTVASPCASPTPLLPEEKQVEEMLFHCPYSVKKESFCPSVLSGNDVLIQHIRECHPGPLVQYYMKPSAPGVKLRLPLSSSKSFRCSSLLSFITQSGSVFFAKVAQTPGYRLVWLWLLGDIAEAEKYRVRLTLPEGDIHTGPVFPLSTSWKDVVESNCCLSIQEGRYVSGNPEVRIEILEMDLAVS